MGRRLCRELNPVRITLQPGAARKPSPASPNPSSATVAGSGTCSVTPSRKRKPGSVTEIERQGRRGPRRAHDEARCQEVGGRCAITLFTSVTPSKITWNWLGFPPSGSHGVLSV
jgi:hypothetical protein